MKEQVRFFRLLIRYSFCASYCFAPARSGQHTKSAVAALFSLSYAYLHANSRPSARKPAVLLAAPLQAYFLLIQSYLCRG